MKRLAAVVAAVGAVAYVTVLQPSAPTPTPTNPYVYCVNVSERECYVNGEVPDGAVIEWAGRSSDVPR